MPLKSIDWTKPIRYTNGNGRPVTLIGKDGENYVVKRLHDYVSYKPDGTGCFVRDRCIENTPPEPKVIYVYSIRHRDDVIISWCWPEDAATVRQANKNCLLSMQKVTLKEGEICGL